jgi:hypothetical protein
MRVVQFLCPERGRRVGLIEGDAVRDLTAGNSEYASVYDLFQSAMRQGISFETLLARAGDATGVTSFPYESLLDAKPQGHQPYLLPPVDHADSHRVLITGTGLTHTGSMQSRDDMHGGSAEEADDSEPETDSAIMFRMGLECGKPADGKRGVAPEWFYKGNGTNLRGHRATLELPAYAQDGGEEPELVGCYIIDETGTPRRLGFALGNEWSDHATEKVNYLYLAPSKLRKCAVGPELITDFDFTSVSLQCRVNRAGETIYDSGELFSGEEHMSHSLANCEDHHFKYAQHRQPGDVHLHYFGTSKLSYGTRDWQYQDGDEIWIEAPTFSAGLVNVVRAGNQREAEPVRVVKA